jgi:isopentenyl-diphosphate Delta-isomerase
MSQRSIRKEEHLALTQMFFNAQKTNSFDQVHLLRPALPESQVNLNAVKTTWFGKELAAPFFINAMTGGSKNPGRSTGSWVKLPISSKLPWPWVQPAS